MGMDDWLEMYPPEDKDGNTDKPKNIPISRKRLLRQKTQRSLDLHGLTVEESRAEVDAFLKSSKRQGLKKVLIIHGKGYHSAGKPVLKNEVINILERSPIAGEFGTADRNEGGSGAVWVLLKY